MSQFLICESNNLSNYGVPLSEIKSYRELYDRVVSQYMKDVNSEHIWVIEEMPDMADQLEKYIPIIDEISRQSELMIFWYGSDFQDLDKVDTRESLMDYLKHDIINTNMEIYLYVDLKHSGHMKYKCLCCGYLTLETRAEFEICHVCFWEDDVYMIIDEVHHKISSLYNENYITEHDEEKLLDIPSEANHGLTLREGRKNYKRFGACDQDMIKYVRKPRKEEYPS